MILTVRPRFAIGFAAVQEQLGLKLESLRAPVEVLAIQRAALATEN